MPTRRDLLAAASAALTLRPPVTAAIREWSGKPTLHIDGKPVYPGFYALTDALGGRWTTDELPQLAIREFVKAGFRLFQVDLFLEDVWPKDGPLVLGNAQRQLRGILDVCPDAAVVIRWHLNAPRWWMEKHPEEVTRYANGGFENADRTQPRRFLMDDLRRIPRVSLASKPWRAMAEVKTRELLQGLAQVPEGRALAGLHVACGVYGEWHYWGFMRNEPDTSAPMQTRFDEWRRAHGRPPTPIPGVDERRATDDGLFRDPGKREAVIDYYRAQQELVADLIIHFCGVVKKSWPRPLLTGCFYGYFFSVFDRSATGGHLCVEKILEAPEIDYLSAPQAYGDAFRGLGGCGITRGLTESARLHGKPFLDEMDQTPSWTWQNNVDTAFRLTDLDSDRAILRRNVMISFLRGTGLWYYDFGPANAAGWWNDSRLMEEVKRMKDVAERYHARRYEPAADVLFVYDTEVFYYTGSLPGTDPLTDRQAVNQTIGAAFASGAALETIHLCDLERIDLQRFKVIVFGNTWVLTDAQRQVIRDKVMRDGRHVVFQGLPGYGDGRRWSRQAMEALLGMELERTDPRPRFQPRGETAKIVRRGNVWFAPDALTASSDWRELFRAAGAHLYVDTADVVHAGAGLVLVHTRDGGPRRIRLRSGRVLEKPMPAKTTWVIDAGSGELVLG